MALTIDGLRLYTAQESQTQATANASVTSAPGLTTDQVFVEALEAQEAPAMSGTATAYRIAQDPDYSDIPRVALAEWLVDFEGLCVYTQATGYTLQDDERDRSINVVVTNATWTLAEGDPLAARWTLETVRGEGVLVGTVNSGYNQLAAPQQTRSLGGVDLGSVIERQTVREMDVTRTNVAFGDPADVVIGPQGGVVRRYTISGRIGGTKQELRQSESDLRQFFGNQQNVTFRTAMPGYTDEVVVTNYRSTYGAGQPNTLRYTLSLVEGEALGGDDTPTGV